jgi:hypothetical protein
MESTVVLSFGGQNIIKNKNNTYTQDRQQTPWVTLINICPEQENLK